MYLRNLPSFVLPALALFAASPLLAQTTCSGNACSVTIAADPNASTSNFGSPGATANAGYTLAISDANGFLTITTSTDPTQAGYAGAFMNLYFDTQADNGLGSNLGLEATNNAFFRPGSSQEIYVNSTSLPGYSTTVSPDGSLITTVIPNSLFFGTIPTQLGTYGAVFGEDVSIHLSQIFSYSVVGGSGNFPAPTELGEVNVDSTPNMTPTPEPSTFALLGTGLAGVAGLLRRKLRV